MRLLTLLRTAGQAQGRSAYGRQAAVKGVGMLGQDLTQGGLRRIGAACLLPRAKRIGSGGRLQREAHLTPLLAWRKPVFFNGLRPTRLQAVPLVHPLTDLTNNVLVLAKCNPVI